MAEHSGDLVASWALHVHEVGVGALHQALLLVLALLLLRGGVQEVLGQRHGGGVRQPRPKRGRTGNGRRYIRCGVPRTGGSGRGAILGRAAAAMLRESLKPRPFATRRAFTGSSAPRSRKAPAPTAMAASRCARSPAR